MHIRLLGVDKFAQYWLRRALDVTYPKYHDVSGVYLTMFVCIAACCIVLVLMLSTFLLHPFCTYDVLTGVHFLSPRHHEPLIHL